MPRYRLAYNGVPFTVDGDGTPEQAQAYLQSQLDADPDFIGKRQKRLGLTDDDVMALAGQNVPAPDTEGKVDRFLIGAGRSFSQMIDGAKQTYANVTGDQEASDEIARQQANETELFNRLDDQGIGFEDLGQMAPDVIAFLGSGGSSLLGQAASFGARGAVLGGLQPVKEGEGLEERTDHSLFSAAMAAGGPTMAKAIGSAFRAGASASKGAFGAIGNMMGRKGSVEAGVADLVGEATLLGSRNGNPAIQQVGALALERVAPIVQKMNSRGKENVVAAMVNNALESSMRKAGNLAVLDPAKFNMALMSIGDTTLKKELGPTLGKQLGLARTTFRELTKIADVDQKTATAILEGLTTSAEARTLAAALGKSADPVVKQGIAKRLVATSTALAGYKVSAPSSQADPE